MDDAGLATVWVAVAGLLGLALGSFANVLIHRVPAGQSVVSPPSACPRCGARIRARHNVPVVGWLWLRGRCADCGAPISARYPAVELLTAVAFVVVTALSGPSSTTPMLLVFVYFGIVLSVVDLETRRLPDPLVLAFAIATAAMIALAGILTGEWVDATRALWGALILGAIYAVAFVAYPRGMGFGDVKLAPVIGAVLAFAGWAPLAVGAFAGFLWGALAGVLVMIRARQGRGIAIPFGPWMFAGAATGLVLGDAVADWYLSLVLT